MMPGEHIFEGGHALSVRGPFARCFMRNMKVIKQKFSPDKNRMRANASRAIICINVACFSVRSRVRLWAPMSCSRARSEPSSYPIGSIDMLVHAADLLSDSRPLDLRISILAQTCLARELPFFCSSCRSVADMAFPDGRRRAALHHLLLVGTHVVRLEPLDYFVDSFLDTTGMFRIRSVSSLRASSVGIRGTGAIPWITDWILMLAP